MADFEKLFRKLGDQATSENTSCKELVAVLNDLKFEIVHGANAGHKIAKHPAVNLKLYPNFNCGHSDGAKVHRQYIKKLYTFVETYKEEIKKEYLK